MNQGEQSSVMKYYDTKHLTEQAYDRSEQERMACDLEKVLAQPDSTEEYRIKSFNDGNSLDQFKTSLERTFSEYSLLERETFPMSTEVTARFFTPHETTLHEADGIPVEMHTSVVAFDVFDKHAENLNGQRPKKGTVILFKLSANMVGETQPAPTMKDFAWNKNCAAGALVVEDGLEFFHLTYSSDEKVAIEVHRKDPTEESGHAVDAQIVEKKPVSPMIAKINPMSEHAVQLKMEVEKFIASRERLAYEKEENNVQLADDRIESQQTTVLDDSKESQTKEARSTTK